MARFGPEERRAFLAQHQIMRRGDDEFYRSHPNVPLPGSYPAPTEVELLSRSWREGDPNRVFVQQEIDVAASGPERGVVYRRRVINLDCPNCGQESLMPQPDPDAPFLCGGCARDAYQHRQAVAAEADLLLRSAVRDLDEILPGYDYPLGNPLTRARYRVAQR